MIYPNGNIEHCKGDTEVFKFNAKKKVGTEKVSCDLNIGDTYIFTVKRNREEDTPIDIQKEFTVTEKCTCFEITLDKTDTKDTCCGDYVYDIRCRTADGKISTPIKERKFTLCKVVGNNV